MERRQGHFIVCGDAVYNEHGGIASELQNRRKQARILTMLKMKVGMIGLVVWARVCLVV